MDLDGLNYVPVVVHRERNNVVFVLFEKWKEKCCSCLLGTEFCD